MQINFQLDGFKPFLGRLIIETIKDEQSVQKYLRKINGLDETSSLILPDSIGATNRVPITTGRIAVIGEKSFGERFAKWYGEDAAKEGKELEVGDIVQFVETQVVKLDIEGKYYMISDEQILGYIKVNSQFKEETI